MRRVIPITPRRTEIVVALAGRQVAVPGTPNELDRPGNQEEADDDPNRNVQGVPPPNLDTNPRRVCRATPTERTVAVGVAWT